MKYQLNGFLIVEGNGDKAYLSSFIDGEIVVLDGYNLKEDTIGYIKELAKKQTPLIMTDPDDAGKKIAQKLGKIIENAVIIDVKLEQRGNYKKTGIAECSKETILISLHNYLKEDVSKNNTITFNWLYNVLNTYNLGINIIQERYNIGQINNKQTIKRLNALGVSKEDIIKFIKGYGNQ